MGKFLVLKCYSDTCNKYQVQQSKKSKKWKCKVCDESQSLKKIYFDSDLAKDCREVCQSLNTKQFTKGSAITRNGEPTFQLASSLTNNKRFEPFEAKAKPFTQEIKRKSSIDEEFERCINLFDMEPYLDQNKISSQTEVSPSAQAVEAEYFKDSKWNEYLSD